MQSSHKLKVATVFSGIGGVEQALNRLAIPHEIVFACDNGDVQLNILKDKELAEYQALQKLRNKKQLKNDKDIQKLVELTRKECSIADSWLTQVKSLNSKIEKKQFVDSLYSESSRQTNFVKKSYLSNYEICEDDFHLDIRFLDAEDYLSSNIDLLVGGSPCQSFSTVGAQHGLDDTRGTLFFDYARIIKECHPKVFIYENVRGLLSHDGGNTLKTMLEVLASLNYSIISPQILNASDFGIPQTRRRLFIIGFRKDLNFSTFSYPNKIELQYKMQDFLEDNCAEGCFNFDKTNGQLLIQKKKGKPKEKFILTPAVQNYVLASGTKNFKTSTEIDLPIARTLMKMMTQHHRAGVDNYITVTKNPLRIRQLSDREALRLMGFPDSFNIVVSSMQMLRQAGNSMVVDVIMSIIKQIIKTGIFD